MSNGFLYNAGTNGRRSKAKYRIIAVRRDGSQQEREVVGAPDDSNLATFGKRHHAAMVIRYFPSKQAWFALDIRSAAMAGSKDGKTGWWTGLSRYEKPFPTAEAAIMWAIHTITAQPVML